MTKLSLIVLPSLLLLIGACGDDPVSYSEPVTIHLKVKSSDVVDVAVSDEKNINTEESNPYGAFIAEAREVLDGNDPGAIEIDDLQLFLGAGSIGVTTLDQIFADQVDVLFAMNDTNDTVPVASATMNSEAGAGPLGLDVEFDSTSLGTDNYDRLVAGGFHVSIRGTAAPDFSSKGADANLELTFHFTAYP